MSHPGAHDVTTVAPHGAHDVTTLDPHAGHDMSTHGGSMDHGASGHGGMTFHSSSVVTLLFDSWSTSNGVSYGVLCLICFIAGIAGVAMKAGRYSLEERLIRYSEGWRKAPKKNRISMIGVLNFIRAAVVFVTLSWDYLLMFAAMTFNVGIFFSVVGGVATGYLFMGHCFVSHREDLSPCGRKVEIGESSTVASSNTGGLNVGCMNEAVCCCSV